jgi:hypothetical protein
MEHVRIDNGKTTVCGNDGMSSDLSFEEGLHIIGSRKGGAECCECTDRIGSALDTIKYLKKAPAALDACQEPMLIKYVLAATRFAFVRSSDVG